MKLKKLEFAFRKKTLGYITAAFGLVAALAWRDAIEALLDHLFPLSRNTVIAKLIYAIIMTLILVIVSVYLVRLLKRK